MDTFTTVFESWQSLLLFTPAFLQTDCVAVATFKQVTHAWALMVYFPTLFFIRKSFGERNKGEANVKPGCFSLGN